MKIILTGTTGFIGSAVLRSALSHPSITEVFCLTRQPVPKDVLQSLPTQSAGGGPKITEVIISDFLYYDKETLEKLQGAEAVVWVLGTPTSGKVVHVDYTLAAAKAFSEALVPKLKEQGKKFRFVYVSGALNERDQTKSLWFLGDARKLRGGVEDSLVEHEKAVGEDVWKSMSARPWLVTQGESLLRFVPGLGGYHIPVEELAAGLVDLAVKGEGRHYVESAELRRIGKRALDTN